MSARVERFIEPVLLLELSGGPCHGYELAERIAGHMGVDSVDYGNLYRLLRLLEEEGIVTSEWNDAIPGRSKRSYELTGEGRELLMVWADSLRGMNKRIAAFLRQYDERTKT